MSIKLIGIFGFLILLGLSSCGKESGFLELSPPPPVPPPVAPPPEPPVTKPIITPTPGTKVNKSYPILTGTTEVGSAFLDILWVIDNSGSMAQYQTAVENNTDIFIDTFSKSTPLLWKMGLISTDTANTPYVGFFTSDQLLWTTPNGVQKFKDAVRRLGTSGDPVEKTFDPTIKHLKANPQFLRPDAYLAIIMVSDAEEQSNVSPQYFSQFLWDLKGGDKKKVLSYGVLWDPTCPNNGETVPVPRYVEFLRLTSGKQYVICQPDYGKVLSEIGKDLLTKVVKIGDTIALEYLPDPATIKVSYKGVALRKGPKSMGGQWVYDPIKNIIRLVDTSMIQVTDPNVMVTYTTIEE